MLLTINLVSVRLFLQQTEIAKRLNTICAQVIPFLSQEVRMCDLELKIWFKKAIYKLECLWLLMIPPAPLGLQQHCVCFAASTASGPSRGASQTGDHGRAKCCYWSTWTARPSAHSVYSFYLVFI